MMLISVSLNLLFLTLFIRSFSEFKNNKFVLPAYITVVLIQWYLNQNGMTFYGRWIILLLNLCDNVKIKFTKMDRLIFTNLDRII